MNRNLWLFLLLTVGATFLLLGFFGREVYRQAPPLPNRVVTPDGRVLFTQDDILTGQQVYQSIGGQQVGTVWGHGAYVAPDWSADQLHREITGLLDLWAQREAQRPYAGLDGERQAALRERVTRAMRTNTWDAASGDVTVSADRALVMAQVAGHYDALFGASDEPAVIKLRDAYALQDRAIPDPRRRIQLTAFFWWTAWSCGTERPGNTVTYTNNWPHEPLIGNLPSSANLLWSIISVVVLIAAIGALVYWQSYHQEEERLAAPTRDPLDGTALTPSMKATLAYGGAVIALFLAQIGFGILTAHYGVEGRGFYGFDLSVWLPYAVTRTWHIQLGIFWIATAFLAAGLFLAPVVGGREPRFQAAGVWFLLVALVVIVVGSLAGEWSSIMQRMGLDAGFWFGHQGYEYVDLGRFWQLFLIVGLVLWLGLMVRGLWPALTAPVAAGDPEGQSRKQLLALFVGSSVAIGLFYGAGLMYGARTHMSVMEYWRWWVVHLWVEGFFEVFATVAISFIFTRLGLVSARSATRAVLFATAIFLLGGIPGTFHHLYFSGTPVSIMAIGAVFSALEVVPLVLVGHEAWKNRQLGQAAPWAAAYRWPIACFLAVAFWNLVGAGVFGFLINPPIALYYLQGLNTTPVHGHTALFGVYGMLSIGMVLFIFRRATAGREWKDGALRLAFWSLNIGLALMVLLSLLPVGLWQAHESIERGLWSARSAEFMQQDAMQTLRWLRAVGDTIFAVGGAALAWFALGLWTGWSIRKG
ncbi:MAG: nitric-oxide reductase large subunit [Planctomycetes bacterium]|nr:nitric-oxide reductase large subunit [Planctomycetota bacterium]